jgi:hypothetical protein
MINLIMVVVGQGLIFVVDSNDRERIKEARDELHRMVSYTCTYQYSLRRLALRGKGRSGRGRGEEGKGEPARKPGQF